MLVKLSDHINTSGPVIPVAAAGTRVPGGRSYAYATAGTTSDDAGGGGGDSSSSSSSTVSSSSSQHGYGGGLQLHLAGGAGSASAR